MPLEAMLECFGVPAGDAGLQASTESFDPPLPPAGKQLLSGACNSKHWYQAMSNIPLSGSIPKGFWKSFQTLCIPFSRIEENATLMQLHPRAQPWQYVS